MLTCLTAKDGQLSLQELDHFRYRAAPSSFSKKTGRVMELSDLQKLVAWKMYVSPARALDLLDFFICYDF